MARRGFVQLEDRIMSEPPFRSFTQPKGVLSSKLPLRMAQFFLVQRLRSDFNRDFLDRNRRAAGTRSKCSDPCRLALAGGI